MPAFVCLLVCVCRVISVICAFWKMSDGHQWMCLLIGRGKSQVLISQKPENSQLCVWGSKFLWAVFCRWSGRMIQNFAEKLHFCAGYNRFCCYRSTKLLKLREIISRWWKQKVDKFWCVNNKEECKLELVRFLSFLGRQKYCFYGVSKTRKIR